MKLSLIILTIKCASWITDRFGDHEKRTTNSMPYPAWITEEMQKGVKDMYTRSQFGATKAIILGDPTLSFFPLLGIQMAPLLMTLVRKGKISSFTYHRVYAISLMMSYLALFVRLLTQPDKLLIVSLAFASMFPIVSRRQSVFPGIYGKFQNTLWDIPHKTFPSYTTLFFHMQRQIITLHNILPHTFSPKITNLSLYTQLYYH